jgi:hypothetical protein
LYDEPRSGKIWREIDVSGPVGANEVKLRFPNEETMERLDMQVELWQESQEKQDDELIPSADPQLRAHWTLGSPDSGVSPTRLDRTKHENPLFRNFNTQL